jgi:two-component system, sensor histidine kinase PdtaS
MGRDGGSGRSLLACSREFGFNRSAAERLGRMINWFRFGRAQTAIYALAVFALIALIAWRVESLASERSRLIEEARHQATTVALGTANYVDRTIDVAELTSDDVRYFIESRGGPAAISHSDLQRYLAAKVRETAMRDFLMVVDAAGNPVAISESPRVPKVNLSDRQWFKAVAGGRSDYVGQAIVSRLGRNIIYTYTKRLTNDRGRMTGAVDVAIQAPSVKNPRQRLPEQPQAQVWTAGGRLIVASFMSFDSHGNPIAQKPPFVRPPKSGAGFLKSKDADLIIAYHRTSDRTLISTVTLKRSEILAPWWLRVRDSAILLFFVALGLGGLVWFANKLLARDARVRKELEHTASALSVAVAQRDTLLKEIHHRVKNNLQVTSSLMEMQAHQFDDEAVRSAFRRTQQRLYAIGMVHDVLYGEQGVSIIDMHEYLTRLCRETARANGSDERNIKMLLDISPISLPAEQATSLGLCVSEVLVNAFRHAFPVEGGGEISLGLRETDGRIELVIRDNGSGLNPSEGVRSLGMRLIRAFATQLGGEFGFESAGGTTFRLAFNRTPIGLRDAMAQ